jgi:SAM-dependent methyltransferase
MHPEIRSRFDLLCRRNKAGRAVLEVGATGSPDTLLTIPALSGAARKVGLNMEPQPALPGVEMVAGNANAMTMFADGMFDVVLCNSMLEHDRNFWLSIAEMRRVLRSGGLMMLGVPAFTARRRLLPRLAAAAGRIWRTRGLAGVAASSPVLAVHRFPADYYRFGLDAVQDVFFAGMDVVSIDEVMNPPRLIGVARRP